MIHGDRVTLWTRTQTGVDPFNAPVYEETAVEVDDVLIGRPDPREQEMATTLYGREISYTLGIPKGDTNAWEAGTVVEFFGEKFVIVGIPETGNPANIPLRWGRNVKVIRYE